MSHKADGRSADDICGRLNNFPEQEISTSSSYHSALDIIEYLDPQVDHEIESSDNPSQKSKSTKHQHDKSNPPFDILSSSESPECPSNEVNQSRTTPSSNDLTPTNSRHSDTKAVDVSACSGSRSNEKSSLELFSFDLHNQIIFTENDFEYLASPNKNSPQDFFEDRSSQITPPLINVPLNMDSSKEKPIENDSNLDFDVELSSFTPIQKSTASPVGSALFASIIEEPGDQADLSQSTLVEIINSLCSEARPRADLPDSDLHDDSYTTTVYILYNNNVTPLSWYSKELDNSDIREMILCACDAIIDRGFILRELIEVDPESPHLDEVVHSMTVRDKNVYFCLGRRYEFEDFHKLVHLGVYTLQPSSERTDLQKITGQRFRKLQMQINPLLHVEAKRAIQIMKDGANLIKYTEGGLPHLRQFQLSSDCKRLLCYSVDSPINKTYVNIGSITMIKLGQRPELNSSLSVPALEQLSFTILYKSESSIAKSLANVAPKFVPSLCNSLHLACKDEDEFDNWVLGLKALSSIESGSLISKEELLSHSKKFINAMVKSGYYRADDRMIQKYQENVKTCLEDCFDLPTLSAPKFLAKLKLMNEKYNNMCTKVKSFDELYNRNNELNREIPSEVEWNPDWDQLAKMNEYTPPADIGSVSIFKSRTEGEDDMLEYQRMHKLQNHIRQLIEDTDNAIDIKASDATLEVVAQVGPNVLKKATKLLWKAEVDLENMEDMLQRLLARRQDSPTEQIFSFFRNLKTNFKMDDELSQIKNKIFSKLTSRSEKVSPPET